MARRNDVKERILDAAAALFMERGFAGTTVREIGEQAGVGQSSLYHHVHSKAQLLRQLHGTFVQDMLGQLELIVFAEELLSPTEQLRSVIHTILSSLDTHLPEVTVYLRESHALPERFRVEVTQERDKADMMVDIVLNRGITSGDFRPDLDVHLTRLAIFGMCNWGYQWYRPGGPQTIDEVSEYFADLVIRGVSMAG